MKRKQSRLLAVAAASAIVLAAMLTDVTPAYAVPPTACVTGSLAYADTANMTKPARNVKVEVWDSDTTPDANDLLKSADDPAVDAIGLTDATGGYHICFVQDDAVGGQDVYVAFVSENNVWRVQQPAAQQPYEMDTTVVNNVANGSDTVMGQYTPAAQDGNRLLRVVEAINLTWDWLPAPLPANFKCWDNNDFAETQDITACHQMVVNWPAAETEFDPAAKQVSIEDADADAPNNVVHELGHAILNDAAEGQLAPGCNPHTDYTKKSTAHCAWDEGFADWVSLSVLGSPIYTFDFGGQTENFETPTWGTGGFETGDTVEARVVGALWDLSDTVNETPSPPGLNVWDRSSDGKGVVMQTVLGPVTNPPTVRVINTLTDFWTFRTADGFNVSDTGGLATLFNNTIDYGLRDPLEQPTPLKRPTPIAPHNFTMSMVSTSWHVVAVKPPVPSDYDLDLYDDKAMTSLLKTSALAGSAIDFIAIDSTPGHRPVDTDYVRVREFSGIGGYEVNRTSSTTNLLPNTSVQFMVTVKNLLHVVQIPVTQGASVTLTLTMSSALDLELFVVDSTASSSTWIKKRGDVPGSMKSTAGGPGVTEKVTFVASTTGTYAAVILLKAGSGSSFTLKRS